MSMIRDSWTLLLLALVLGAGLLGTSGCATRATEAPVDAPPDVASVERESEIADKPIHTFEPATRPAREARADGTNVRVNQDSSGRDQNETSIAISPTDPDTMIGGANDARTGSWSVGYYITHDGGQTWTDGVMPDTVHPNQADPTIAFCGDGTALYGYLDYIGSYQPHRLVVAHSTNGGDTWQPAGVVYEGSTPFADKPWLACAPAGGVYGNRAYISWTHFSTFSGNIRVAYSTDHGQTWQGERAVSNAGVQGSIPVPARDGLVHLFWKGPGGIDYTRSTNGGGSWSTARQIATVQPIGGTSFRRNSHPSAGVDNSDGPYAGHVYVVWSDQRDGDPDIYFTRSTDGGLNFEAPRRINDDAVGNGRDQFFPWLAVDDKGLVHVMWHDRRDDPANEKMHVMITSSRDGGASFDRNLRVTDVVSDGSLTGFLGDYAALAAWGGRIVPLWSDLRAGTGEEDAYIEVEPAFEYDIVANLTFASDGEHVSFVDQEPRLGAAIVYDVLVGEVSDLRSADPWASARCHDEDLAAPPALIAEEPLPGEALWVLIRAQGPRGRGSFGSSSGHPDERDPLDTAPACD